MKISMYLFQPQKRIVSAETIRVNTVSSHEQYTSNLFGSPYETGKQGKVAGATNHATVCNFMVYQ